MFANVVLDVGNLCTQRDVEPTTVTIRGLAQENVEVLANAAKKLWLLLMAARRQDTNPSLKYTFGDS